MVIGIAIVIPFTLGEALLGLEAYFIRDWKTLQVVAHLPLLCEDRLINKNTFCYSSIGFSVGFSLLDGS